MNTEEFKLRPVTLDDKELFDKYFKDSSSINSEYTFTNMFMWRNSYNIRYALIDEMLCIFSKHGNGPETINFPLGIGDIKLVIEKIIKYFKTINQRPLIRIYSEDMIDILKSLFPDTFIITEDIDSFDYVYETEDLIELPGNKYHSKRNHINKFKSLYNYEYHRLTPDSKDACLSMFNHWCDSKEGLIPGISEQREAVTELLQNWKALDITGGGITVDGKMIAFSFGEVLSQKHSIAVIHLEHADTEFHGSFPLMNQQFLENEWSHLEYVNREEDMGLPGLRKAKQSYKPCLMVKKYIATLK